MAAGIESLHEASGPLDRKDHWPEKRAGQEGHWSEPIESKQSLWHMVGTLSGAALHQRGSSGALPNLLQAMGFSRKAFTAKQTECRGRQ